MEGTETEGRIRLGCFPLYQPLELFHAMGFFPQVLWGFNNEAEGLEESDKHLQNFSCSVARRLTQFVLNKGPACLDALFMYNACDTLRNLPEILSFGLKEKDEALPLIRLHLPAVFPEQVNASVFLRQQITALIGSLEQIGGLPFNAKKFKQSCLLYGRIRLLSLQLEKAVSTGRLSYAVFTEKLLKNCFRPAEEQLTMLETLAAEISLKTMTVGGIKSGRVVISGIMPPPASLIGLIESSGLIVAGNDVAAQRRSYGHQSKITDDPYQYYSDLYCNHTACPTLLYSAERRADELLNYVQKAEADGVIFIGEKFCEYEYFEFPYLTRRLKDKGRSSIILEISAGESGGTGSFQTRIEAFAEMLSST